jgi:periplasmic protein TonB
VVEFIVDENGFVQKPAVVKSSNDGFNQVSLDSIRKWRFEPGQKDGKTVKVRMRMPFVFNLK